MVFRFAVFGMCLVAALVWTNPGTIEAGELAVAGGPNATKLVVPEIQPAKGASPTVDALGDPLPDGALLRLGTSRFQCPSGVVDLAISPDGKSIVTTGRQLIVWDAVTGKERWRSEDVWEPPGAAYGIRSVAFGPDGRFYTLGTGGVVVRWEIPSRRRETLNLLSLGASRSGWSPNSRAIDVSPDGSKIAIGDAAGLVVWDVNAMAELCRVANNPKSRLNSRGDDRLTFGGDYCAGWFSRDGKLLAVVASEKPSTIQIVDVANGRKLRELTLAAKLVRLAFSPDSRQIVATERDNAVRLYDVTRGERVWSHVVKLTNIYENYTSAVAFSPNGSIVAACATDNRIYLLGVADGKEVGRLRGHHWYPWALAFTSDSKLLYSSGWEGTIRRWDVADRKQLPPPRGHHATSVCAASPDGRTLAYVDDLQTIYLVRAEDGVEFRWEEVAETEFSCLAFSPSGLGLAAGGSADDHVMTLVCEIMHGVPVCGWNWPKGHDPYSSVESLSFSPDRTRLAAAVSRQSAAYVWDFKNCQKVAQLAHSGIYGLSFSPDGRTLATAGWDSKIRFWDTATWKVRREFKIEGNSTNGEERMYAVCYAPQGGLLATAHLSGGDVRIWKADDMTLVKKFRVSGGFYYGSIAFSPDGLWLAAGSVSGAVTLWDPLTGQLVWQIGRHEGHVYTVSFGQDSRTLLSGGDDNVCYLWNVWPQQSVIEKDPALLWDGLIGQDGRAAYHAMSKLSQMADRTIALLNERTGILKEPKRSIAARRAVWLAEQIGTPAAINLVEKWSLDDPNGPLGRAAVLTAHRLHERLREKRVDEEIKRLLEKPVP
jgi:WD40 repeat protein